MTQRVLCGCTCENCLALKKKTLTLTLSPLPFVNFSTYLMVIINRPLPSSPGPLYQNEVNCSAFDMEMIFQSLANKTHFHKKGCALSLILKVRVLGTRKWPI